MFIVSSGFEENVPVEEGEISCCGDTVLSGTVSSPV